MTNKVNQKEKNFFVLLPDSLIKVLRIKMVDDKLLKLPIPMGQLVLIGAIVGLSREKGYSYAENSSLAKLTTIAKGSIEDYLTKLEKADILYRYYVDKSRRIRINNKLVEKYPEITKDIFQEDSENQSEDSENQSEDSENQSEDSENQSEDSENQSEDSENQSYTYYIYKLKESITKLKENKDKDFWLVNLEDEEFKTWLKNNPFDYKQSQIEAFHLISTFYPVKAKTKEARVAFEKLNEQELKELFQSMPTLLDHVETQKIKNAEAGEHVFKYVEKFVNYISKKSFKNYQKKFREGRVFGLEAFEGFLERIEEYAYEMTEEGFFLASERDAQLDYDQLKVIVWNYKKGKTIDELRPYCRVLTGFKEEVTS